MKYLSILATMLYLILSPAVQATSTGKEIASNYYNTAANCGSSNHPAFICSGVMLRGGNPGAGYHIWDPSPSAESSGGISFSYLRADAKFSKLVFNYNSGYIFYPYQKAPRDKISPEVLCSFPLDGDTYGRSNKGCGAHRLYPTQSRECQSQGIKTAKAWYNHYNKLLVSKNQHQCGFNVSRSAADNASMFKASIDGAKKANGRTVGQQNEIVLSSWSKSVGRQLPIQAFFYLNNGLANAQYNQKDYYNQFGVIIPIVKITLPQKTSQDASFNYYADDQAVTNNGGTNGGNNGGNNVGAVSYTVSMPGGQTRYPLNAFLPSNYNFQAYRAYKLEITIPKNNGNIYTCINRLVFNPSSKACVDGVLPSYDYSGDIQFTPYIGGILKNNNSLIGPKYLVIPKATSIKCTLTPL